MQTSFILSKAKLSAPRKAGNHVTRVATRPISSAVPLPGDSVQSDAAASDILERAFVEDSAEPAASTSGSSFAWFLESPAVLWYLKQLETRCEPACVSQKHSQIPLLVAQKPSSCWVHQSCLCLRFATSHSARWQAWTPSRRPKRRHRYGCEVSPKRAQATRHQADDQFIRFCDRRHCRAAADGAALRAVADPDPGDLWLVDRRPLRQCFLPCALPLFPLAANRSALRPFVVVACSCRSWLRSWHHQVAAILVASRLPP